MCIIDVAQGCAEMRAILGADACGECLASHGQELPAALLLDAQVLKVPEPSLGSCLWNANLAQPSGAECPVGERSEAQVWRCAWTPGSPVPLSACFSACSSAA